MTVSVVLGVNQRLEVSELGDFFRLMEAELTVSVEFYFNGRKVKEAKNVRSGYAEEMTGGTVFDKVVIANGAVGQNIQYVVRQGSRVEYDVPPVGNVAITNKAGPHTLTTVAVAATAGGTSLSAANGTREYLLVQNTDDASTMWVTTDGSTPTLGHGIKLLPNSDYEPGFVPTGQVRAISDTAGAVATVVEG
jgi:hypothetical protein